jgi:hypothetical protein
MERALQKEARQHEPQHKLAGSSVLHHPKKANYTLAHEHIAPDFPAFLVAS